MRRWRNSVATTIALTVVAAMVLGVSLQQLVSSGLLFLGLERQQKENARLFLQLPNRVAVLIEVISATPDPKKASRYRGRPTPGSPRSPVYAVFGSRAKRWSLEANG